MIFKNNSLENNTLDKIDSVVCTTNLDPLTVQAPNFSIPDAESSLEEGW